MREEDLSIPSTEQDAAPGITPQPWPDRSRPFTAGNGVALRHGARSPGRVGERAEEMAEAFLNAPSTPDYCRELSYRSAVMAWARATAIVEFYWNYVCDQDPEVLIADVTTTDESEQADGGHTTRHSVSRRVESALTQLHRAETRAASARRDLGLTPMARYRMGRDAAATRFDLAREIAELGQAADG